MAFFLILSLLLVQTPAPAVSVDEKSQAIIDHAITALGGPKYLGVQTAIGKGFFTSFKDGMTQLPSRFLDYIRYPDNERTEFNSNGIRAIQTNTGDTGWVYDGGPKKISDQGPAQVAEFKRSLRTSLEYLLRGYWKKDGGKITYVGRREAGLAKRNETIRLTLSDGYWIEYEFGAKDNLPSKILYKRERKDPDSGDTVETSEEDQFFKFIEMDGVTSAWVIDHYINGHQSSRINYESVQYNQTFPADLFTKPANIKAIK